MLRSKEGFFADPYPPRLQPLNITHTAIFRSHDNETLLRAGTPDADKLVNETPATASSSSSPLKAHTPLRHTLHTLLNFFAATYKHVFSFNEGPPVHDALCIAYLARPDIFHAKRYRVDVELEGAYTQGTTVVDLYDYRKDELKDFIADPESRSSWGKFGKNALLLEELDVSPSSLYHFGHFRNTLTELHRIGRRVLETVPSVCRQCGQGFHAEQSGEVARGDPAIPPGRLRDYAALGGQ